VRAIDRPRLETDRLALTPMTMDDVDAYLGLHSDPDVIAFLGEMDPALAVARLEKDERQWETFGYGLFKLTARDDGRFLGRVGLRYWPQFDETEVGWTLRREEWGHGYATEAAVAVATWGFREHQVGRDPGDRGRARQRHPVRDLGGPARGVGRAVAAPRAALARCGANCARKSSARRTALG